MTNRVLAALGVATTMGLVGPLSAQSVPTPESVLGFRPGADFELATYDKADQFDRTAAVGFITIWGLPVKVQSQVQPAEEE